jgi:putative endopeptidase
MHLKQIMKRTVAMALILTMLLGLCGCDAAEMTDSMSDALSAIGLEFHHDPTQRLDNSAWINSDLEGSVTETSELNLKDDFHAAANRDWFLEHDSEGNGMVSTWDPMIDALADNIHTLMQRGNSFTPDPNIMSQEELNHLLDLVWDMVDLAANQDKRNELGVEPLHPYLEAIENIDSLDEMTEYLKNTDKTNITGENFVNFDVDSPINSRDFYTVNIEYPKHRLLCWTEHYNHISFDSYQAYQEEKAAVEHVLGQLGYSPDDISKLLYNCYTFERRFANMIPTDDETGEHSYKNRNNKIYTLEDIAKRQGNFPLTELLESAGVSHSETFRIMEPIFLDFMGSYYKEKNLDRMKSYFMVHTILEALPYLDETCQAMGAQIKDTRDVMKQNPPAPVPPEDPTDAAAMEAYERTVLTRGYIYPLLSEPFQLAYVGSFCSSETKQEITKLVDDVIDYYVEFLGSIDWLSQQTRDLAVEKVKKTAVMVMYPDVLPDYSSLEYGNYDEGGNLLDAVAAINQRKHAPDAEKVNQPVNRADWDLSQIPTIDTNAYNNSEINGIIILAGVLEGGFMYDPDAPIEQNYGRLGTTLGHEITHSFDTTGYGFDADGLPYGWWTNDDEVALRLRSDRLASHYNQLSYLPGTTGGYQGALVKGEAMSDMGGVKCMLTLAEEIPDFDYDLFFRSYASLWAYQTSRTSESLKASDAHPLGFFRTNVTLQQFDKFLETYDIGPGDGMYLAPEDRILVW